MPPVTTASASRRRNARRCTTRTSGRPNGCSTRPSPRAWRGSSTSRRSTSSATRRAGSSTRRTGATRARVSSATTTRPSTWPTGRRGADRGRRADRHRHAGDHLRPGDHSAIGAQLQAAYDGTRRYIGARRHRDLAAHVDDLADAGSSPRSTAAGRGGVRHGRRRTCALGDAMRLAARPAAARRRAGHPERRSSGSARACPARGALLGCPPDLREIVSACGRRDLLGDRAKAATELGYAPRDLAIGARDAFEPRTGPPTGLTRSYTPAMARDLPMFDPAGDAHAHRPELPSIALGGGLAGLAGRRRLHRPPPPPRLDPCPDAVGRELPRPQGPAPRPRPQHGLRGGPLPEHRGVLGPAHRHDHDPGRHLHPGLRVLRGQDRPADLVRRRRAAPRRRGGRRDAASSTSS